MTAFRSLRAVFLPVAAGYGTEQGAPDAATRGSGFVAVRQPAWLADVEGVRAALSSGNHAMLDARSASRFAGKEASRGRAWAGHIPDRATALRRSLPGLQR